MNKIPVGENFATKNLHCRVTCLMSSLICPTAKPNTQLQASQFARAIWSGGTSGKSTDWCEDEPQVQNDSNGLRLHPGVLCRAFMVLQSTHHTVPNLGRKGSHACATKSVNPLRKKRNVKSTWSSLGGALESARVKQEYMSPKTHLRTEVLSQLSVGIVLMLA